MTDTKSIEKMSFEEALSELEAIVKKIDSGQENLADAVISFERGVTLKKHCQKMLAEAELRIQKVVKSESGEITVEETSI